MRERTIDLLPDLSTRHISLLDDLVTSTVNKCKTSEDQFEQAHSLWISLDTLAKSKFKGKVFREYFENRIISQTGLFFTTIPLFGLFFRLFRSLVWISFQ